MKTNLRAGRLLDCRLSLINSIMKVRFLPPLPILAFLMLATVAQATDVTFSFSDFTTGTSYFSATNIVLRVKMLSAITVNGSSVVLKDWINYTNSATGTTTISNMIPGVYSCTLTAKNTESPFQITVTNSASAISASSIITTATNVTGSASQAYSMAAADARFVRSVLAGAVCYVEGINGSDSTGTRGRLDKPFLTVTAAVNAATSGDLVRTLPKGSAYNVGTNNILKAGLNYDFVFAPVIWTNTFNADSASYQGLFDDRKTGPTTNWIRGSLFTYWASPSKLLKGMLVVTNPLTEIHFIADRVEGSSEVSALPAQQTAVDNAFIHNKGGKVFLHIGEIEDIGRYTWGLDDLEDTVLTNAPAISGIYWEQGTTYAHVDSLRVFNGYALWGHEPTNQSISEFHYEGGLVEMRSNGVAAIYMDSSITVASPNFKSWWSINEAKSPGFCISLIGLNKFYFERAGKVTGNPALLSSSIVWGNIQKLSGNPQALSIQGGEHHLTIQHFENSSALAPDPFMDFNGGDNHIIGGRAKISSGNMALVRGGTNLLQGLILDTTGAGNAGYPINVVTNNLTLQDVTLISGSTNSIFATNAQTVTVNGLLTTVSNINANVTVGPRTQNGIIYADGTGITNVPATDTALRAAFITVSNSFLSVSNAHLATSNQVTVLTSAVNAGSNAFVTVSNNFLTVSNNFLSVSNAHIAASNKVTVLTAAVNAASNSLAGVSNDVVNLKALQQNFLPGLTVTLTTNNTTNVTIAVTNAGGYVLEGFALGSSSPADSTTYFPTDLITANNIDYTNAFTYIPRNGVLKWYEVRVRASVLASGETVQHFVRLNNATDVGEIDCSYAFTNVIVRTNLSQAVTTNDTIALKVVTPAWVTNPTTVRWWAKFYIEF